MRAWVVKMKSGKFLNRSFRGGDFQDAFLYYKKNDALCEAGFGEDIIEVRVEIKEVKKGKKK